MVHEVEEFVMADLGPEVAVAGDLDDGVQVRLLLLFAGALLLSLLLLQSLAHVRRQVILGHLPQQSLCPQRMQQVPANPSSSGTVCGMRMPVDLASSRKRASSHHQLAGKRMGPDWGLTSHMMLFQSDSRM